MIRLSPNTIEDSASFSRGEYWVENSYSRLYSIVKHDHEQEIHFFVMFSNLNHPDEPFNIQWTYTGIDHKNPDPEITLKQYAIIYFITVIHIDN